MKRERKGAETRRISSAGEKGDYVSRGHAVAAAATHTERLLREKNNSQAFAGMAELADALDSGSSRGNLVKVQVLLPAPK